MEFIYKPWPWYFSGFMIALCMFLLLMVGKNFGMSSNLRTLCTLCGAGKKVSFFKFNWKEQQWNLWVAVGVIIGGFIAANFLSSSFQVVLNPLTIFSLETLGFTNPGETYLPEELFSNTVFTNIKTFLILALGGFLVGFGARYAGGCTSGHAISGLSNLQLPSLLAVLGFFVGGLFMVHIIFPILF